MLDCFKEFYSIEKVLLFGSRAMGNHKKGSDIDLAVVGKEFTFHDLGKLKTRLNDELPIPYFVDVIHVNTLNNRELLAHINQKGKVIYPVNLVATNNNS